MNNINSILENILEKFPKGTKFTITDMNNIVHRYCSKGKFCFGYLVCEDLDDDKHLANWSNVSIDCFTNDNYKVQII